MKWLWIALGAVALIFGAVAGIGAFLPQDHTVTRSARFQQRPQVIWDVLTGPPTWRPDVKSFETLPPRNGHRTWKEVDAHGKAITYESVEETPPFRLITRTADQDLPYGGIWIHEISIDSQGCVLQITEDGHVYNPIYRFMYRFVFGYTATMDAFLNALHAKLDQTGG